MALFALGAVDPLLVDAFDGFDRPTTAQLVSLIGLDDSSNDQVLQQGNRPFAQAHLTGTSTTEAELATLRGYGDSHEALLFRDGNGNTRGVRVLEFTGSDRTDYSTWSMTLVDSDVGVGSSS